MIVTIEMIVFLLTLRNFVFCFRRLDFFCACPQNNIADKFSSIYVAFFVTIC